MLLTDLVVGNVQGPLNAVREPGVEPRGVAALGLQRLARVAEIALSNRVGNIAAGNTVSKDERTRKRPVTKKILTQGRRM